MTILHLSSEATWRGGEQQIAYLIDEHLKMGLNVMVACRSNSSFSEYCKKNNISHFDCPFNGSFDWKTVGEIKKICRENKVDIMHCHSGKSHALAVLSYVRGNKTAIVLSRRVDFPIKSNPWAKWKYNHKSIRKIVCVSDAINSIVKQGVKDQSKVVTVHSGIDFKRFENAKATGFLRKKYSVDQDELIIGNTSAIAPHKDYFTFLNTVKILVDEGLKARFFIIGKGPMEDEIKAYCHELGLQDKVLFTGFLNNIEEVLPELDLFLMTSETEGLGTSLIDALAVGVPVLATAAGGIPEVIVDGFSGLLCPVKSPVELAKSVNRLIADSDLKSQLVKNGKQHAQNFSKKETARKTLAVYNEILG